MTGRTRGLVLGIVVLLLLAGAAVILQARSGSESGDGDETGSPSAPGTTVDKRPATGLPLQARVPQPLGQPFAGCPPEGSGGDRTLNRLKNRDDTAVWLPVAFEALEKLAWPKGIETGRYDTWPADARAQVDAANGIPVAIEGYLFNTRRSGPESGNCSAKDKNDYHMWLTATANEDRTHSIVVEPTPRILAVHPKWTVANLNTLAHNHERVRISGWTMLDPEHPDQVGKTRGTIWEIHPVMLIEVQRDGHWVPIDDVLK